jgi:hypothetical protein
MGNDSLAAATVYANARDITSPFSDGSLSKPVLGVNSGRMQGESGNCSLLFLAFSSVRGHIVR